MAPRKSITGISMNSFKRLTATFSASVVSVQLSYRLGRYNIGSAKSVMTLQICFLAL